MSTEEPQPAEQTPAPATPIWKSKWAIGGAVVVAALVFYQMNQRSRGPEIPVVPLAPGPAPVQPGPETGLPPVTPAPTGLPVAGGPAPGAPQAPGVVPTATEAVVPMLAPPNGPLPWITVSYTPVIGYMMDFTLRSTSGVLAANMMMPDGWDSGPAVLTYQRPGANGAYVHSVGGAVAERRHFSGVPARVIVPNWTMDSATVGGTCLAFIGQQGALDVEVRNSTMCVMDRACQQYYACGKTR